MFRKLRNKLLIVNTLIIAALVLGSFSVIYAVTARNVNAGIRQRLVRASDIVRNDHSPKKNDAGEATQVREPKDPKPSDEGAKPNDAPGEPEGRPGDIPNDAPNDIPNEAPNDAPNDAPNGEPSEAVGRQDTSPVSATFTVKTDSYGNIEEINIPFDLDEDFYTEKMPNIVLEGDDGEIKSDSGYWAYRVTPTHDGYITAFTECHAEHTMLRNLFLILLLVGVGALTAAFLISLISANRSIKPVEESYNKQKQFVADASHELKTPLTTINTNVDVLLSHEECTIGEERKWLDYIKTETERMTKLTNDLLYLAKLDHGENNMLFSRVSFSEAAENVILLMEAVTFEKNINLSYDIATDVYVNGSSEQLKQVTMILLDNAVKYTPKSGDIKISLTQESSDAVLRVRNSGEGIGEEAQKHIFDRFYREDKSRARESGGYGLGLAIAKAVVTSCRGSIRVASEKNKYTEFTVHIPLMK